MAQYALDLSAAQTFSDAAVQSILNTLNPSLGALSDEQLASFEQQLAAIGTGGSMTLQGVQIDQADSTGDHTVYNMKFAAGQGVEAQAGGGFDTISASGLDTVYGSTSATGAAKLVATGGDNLLIGGAGEDSLYAGSGQDTLVGGDGNQALYGSSSHGGAALLIGGSGDQVLKAGSGNDTLAAGSGNDTLYGGAGSSTLMAGYGHDTMYGGSGPTAKTTFVVTSDTFNDDVIKGGALGATNVLDLADLNRSDVNIATNAKTGVTTVSYGGHSIEMTKVGEIDFANGQHLKL
jgi:Ca2+-binding RTX toxin-like protein